MDCMYEAFNSRLSGESPRPFRRALVSGEKADAQSASSDSGFTWDRAWLICSDLCMGHSIVLFLYISFSHSVAVIAINIWSVQINKLLSVFSGWWAALDAPSGLCHFSNYHTNALAPLPRGFTTDLNDPKCFRCDILTCCNMNGSVLAYTNHHKPKIDKVPLQPFPSQSSLWPLGRSRAGGK
jgi:hypothetical protein